MNDFLKYKISLAFLQSVSHRKKKRGKFWCFKNSCRSKSFKHFLTQVMKKNGFVVILVWQFLIIVVFWHVLTGKTRNILTCLGRKKLNLFMYHIFAVEENQRLLKTFFKSMHWKAQKCIENVKKEILDSRTAKWC